MTVLVVAFGPEGAVQTDSRTFRESGHIEQDITAKMAVLWGRFLVGFAGYDFLRDPMRFPSVNGGFYVHRPRGTVIRGMRSAAKALGPIFWGCWSASSRSRHRGLRNSLKC